MLGPRKRLQFLVSACVASDPCVKIVITILLFFLLRNDVQLQSKLLDRLEFCHAVFKPTFSYRGMNVCPIYAASLSHDTLCMGNLVWYQYIGTRPYIHGTYTCSTYLVWYQYIGTRPYIHGTYTCSTYMVWYQYIGTRPYIHGTYTCSTYLTR